MTNILIADDDANIRELMSFFLQNEGFDVIEAENGEAALAALESTAIDLVILDIMMPLYGRLGFVQRDPESRSPYPPLNGYGQRGVGT